jgi:DNA-binding CsgD family transcriptional regulator
LVLATDVGRYKLAEQLVRWIASRLDAGEDSSTFAAGDAATMLRTCFPDLTQRESEVLWEAVIGKGYHEIATALGMQPTTVRNHLQRILTRLGVHSQRQAVLKAVLALVTPRTGSQAAPSMSQSYEVGFVIKIATKSLQDGVRQKPRCIAGDRILVLAD